MVNDGNERYLFEPVYVALNSSIREAFVGCRERENWIRSDKSAWKDNRTHATGNGIWSCGRKASTSEMEKKAEEGHSSLEEALLADTKGGREREMMKEGKWEERTKKGLQGGRYN